MRRFAESRGFLLLRPQDSGSPRDSQSLIPGVGSDPGGNPGRGVIVELVAAEPLVTDPIALAIDENLRMYVVEMNGYSENRDEKLSRMDRDMDENKRRMDRLMLDRARPALGMTDMKASDPVIAEHKAAFEAYIRGGEAGGRRSRASIRMSPSNRSRYGWTRPTPGRSSGGSMSCSTARTISPPATLSPTPAILKAGRS